MHFFKTKFNTFGLQNLWSKCQQMFMEHKINPEIAGDFFYNLGNVPEKATSGIKLFVEKIVLRWGLHKPNSQL
jgi:hypothetical protein